MSRGGTSSSNQVSRRRAGTTTARLPPKPPVTVANELPRVPENSKVWNALKDHGQFSSEEDARATLKEDTLPFIFVEKMEWLGRFNPRKPKTISISDKLVEDYGQDSDNQEKKRKVEATVLHELVHCGLRMMRT